MPRLPITKTPKVYVGGAFICSESGRVEELRDAAGGFVANIPQCTRKDLRNAVEAVAKAGPGWAKRSGYNRAQIMYRIAEMLESRASEMTEALQLGAESSPIVAGNGRHRRRTGRGSRRDKDTARREVAAACDRLVYFAGWADKFEQVLGNTNPVAGPFFNFTVCEPMGVVGVVAGDASPLLGLVSQIAPIVICGNTVVAHASEAHPYPAILLGEVLAVSDLPAGVINLLTGRRKDLLPTFATHAHLRGVDAVVFDVKESKTLGLGAAESVKRVKYRSADELNWFDESQHESVYAIRDFIEYKTTWHPVGA